MKAEGKIETIKDNTIKMYDNTIEEMKKRGATEDEIALVEHAKEQAIIAYDNQPSEDNKCPINTMITEIYPWAKDFSPLLSNLFIVRIGDVPIHLNRLLVVNHDEKTLTLSSCETEDFSPLNYFLKNKKFDKLEVEYLNPQGKKVRTDTFKSLKAKKFFSSYLSYTHDNPLITEITFQYKEYESSAR